MLGVDTGDFFPIPGFVFHRTDVLYTAPGMHRYDVAICTEMAEHLPESRADDVVKSVAERALKCIVWSAAQPGQEWEGHVNMQPPAYWLEKFARYGWIVDEYATGKLRALMVFQQAQHWMGVTNFHILVRS